MAGGLDRPGRYEYLWCENRQCKEYRKPRYYHESDLKVCSACKSTVKRALWVCESCGFEREKFNVVCPRCKRREPYIKQNEHRMRSFGLW